MKKVVFVLMAIMLTAVLVPLYVHPPASAATTSVRIDVGFSSEKSASSDFTAMVYIYDVTNFHAANYSITWNSSVLRCDGIVAGMVNITSLQLDDWDINNVAGVLNVNSSLVTPSDDSGSGWLSTISFHVKGSLCDASGITFDSPLCHLWTAGMIEIVPIWLNASIHVGQPIATPSVSPTMTASPTISATLSPTPSPTCTGTCPTATPTRTASPTPTASATGVSTTPTPTVSPTVTATAIGPTPTPTLMMSMNSPAHVTQNGNFTARVDVTNVNLAAGNYTINYTFAYDKNVITLTNVTAGVVAGGPIPVTSWSLVPAGVQGVANVVQNISAATAVTSGGYLANMSFSVVGTPDSTSNITFNQSDCGVYVLPAMTKLPAGWLNDMVRVVATATAMPTATVTVTPTATNTSGTGVGGGGGTPSWLWPVVGVMLFLTFVLFGYAAHRAGWIGKPKGWFGGQAGDYTADGFGEEDVYDKLYGDTGGGIDKGTGGGSDMGNDKL